MREQVAEQDNSQPASLAGSEASTQADLSGLDSEARELLTRLEGALAEFHPQLDTLKDIPQVTIDAGALAKACRKVKDDPGINASQLMCLACVDYQESFQLVYILHSMDPEGSIAIKADLPYDQPKAPSVASVWRAAEWYEREAHDLFGVVFEGHPDLAPLLLYEGFEGYPGRKEFPFHEYQEF